MSLVQHHTLTVNPLTFVSLLDTYGDHLYWVLLKNTDWQDNSHEHINNRDEIIGWCREGEWRNPGRYCPRGISLQSMRLDQRRRTHPFGEKLLSIIAMPKASPTRGYRVKSERGRASTITGEKVGGLNSAKLN